MEFLRLLDAAHNDIMPPEVHVKENGATMIFDLTINDSGNCHLINGVFSRRRSSMLDVKLNPAEVSDVIQLVHYVAS